MTRVEWSAEAREDLWSKVRFRRVRRELVELSKTFVHADTETDNAYCGRAGRYCWHRGMTPERLAEIARDPKAAARSDTGRHACDYVLVYERSGHLKPSYKVLGVFRNSEYSAAFQEIVGLTGEHG